MDDKIEHTLLSINRSLKEKSDHKKVKNKIVFRIWTKEKNKMAFQSEASTLNFFNKKWAKNKCPYCESLFGKCNLKHSSDTLWIFTCPNCKSTLTVLNE